MMFPAAVYHGLIPQIPATSSLIVRPKDARLKMVHVQDFQRARAGQTLHLWLNLTVENDDSDDSERNDKQIERELGTNPRTGGPQPRRTGERTKEEAGP